MRSLWLASAAIIVSTGIACAQTSMSSSPTSPETNSGSSGSATQPAAPGGAPAMSSSSMAPATSGKPTASPLTDSGSSGTATQPPSTAPNMSPSAASTSMAPMPAKPMVHHHMTMTSMKMPPDADAGTYLSIAKKSVMHHNKMMADEALSRAETRILTRSVPADEAAQADNSQGVAAVESARKAVAAGDMKAATTSIDQAMMMDGQMAGGGSTGGMGTMTPMPASAPAAHAPMPLHPDASDSGFGGSPDSTSDSGAAGPASSAAVNSGLKSPTTP